MLNALFRGTAIALLVQISGLAVTYMMQVLLARWMGATQYGVYDYLTSIATFLGFVAGLGLPNSLLRFIPEYSVKQEWGKLRGIIWSSWRYVSMSSVAVALMGVLIVSIWNKNNSHSHITTSDFLWGLSTIPLWTLVRHQREMSRGIKRMTIAYLPYNVIFPLLIIGAGFCYRDRLSSNLGMSSASLAIAFTGLSLCLILIFQLWLFKRQLPKSCRLTPAVYSRREWFAVAIPLLLNDSGFVLLSQTDTIMTGAILGSYQVGIYSAGFKTAAGVSFVLAAVNAIAAPMFATLYAEQNYVGLQKLTATVARWMFYPTLLAGLLLMVFGDRVLSLFGEEFVAARWSMTILILGQLVNVGAGSVGYLMQMTGHHKQCAYVIGCSAILNLILNAILIPIWGIMGAAIATALTMALWNVWLHQLVVKHLGVQPSIVATFDFKR